MKRVFFFSLFLFIILACKTSVQVGSSPSPVPQPTNISVVETVTSVPTIVADSPIPATGVPNLPMSFEGVEVAVDPLHITLLPTLSSGARGTQVPRAEGENVEPWGVTPGHIQLTLEGYPLQNRFQEPQIYV